MTVTLAFQKQFDLGLMKVMPLSSFCLKNWGIWDECPLAGSENLPMHNRCYPEAVKARLKTVQESILCLIEAAKQTGGQRLVLGTGCGLPVITPFVNIMAAREAVEEMI